MRAHGHSSPLALGANSSTAPVALEFLIGSGVIAGWFLASALLVAWLSVVAWMISPSPTSVHTAARSAKIEAAVSRTAFKGDRLDFPRKSANPNLGTAKSSQAPIGCEPAFSKLVNAGFRVRCVT